MKTPNWHLTFLFLPIITFFTTAQAMEVQKVKGKKVMIRLSEGEQTQVGDQYFVMKGSKKTGVVKIMKVSGDRAFGSLKGKAAVGSELMEKTQKKKVTRTKPQPNSGGKKVFVGAMLGMGLNSMDVKNTNTNVTNSLSGSGINFTAFLDYPFTKLLNLRGYVGMLNLNADNTCTDCKVEIGYVQLGGSGRFVFDMGSFKPWVGGGYNAIVPMSKDKTTALDADKIALTSIIGFYAGLDYHINSKMMIPIEFSYNLLPSSDSVSGNIIGINVGFGYGF